MSETDFKIIGIIMICVLKKIDDKMEIITKEEKHKMDRSDR